jgi:hypothetical protein
MTIPNNSNDNLHDLQCFLGEYSRAALKKIDKICDVLCLDRARCLHRYQKLIIEEIGRPCAKFNYYLMNALNVRYIMEFDQFFFFIFCKQ